MADDVRAGLTVKERELAPKWCHNAKGSALFEEITRLPEYYLTRCEWQILSEHAPEIGFLSKSDTLIELGAGTSVKTRLLLNALSRAAHLRRYIPFDMDESSLMAAEATLSPKYPGVEVCGILGDYERHLISIPTDGRRLMAFLGGTIGNLRPPARRELLSSLRGCMATEDMLLLGADLIKPRERLVAAYDDRAGTNAAFARNALSVINTELNGNFNLDAFAYIVSWDPIERWIDMRLRSTIDQVVKIDALALELKLDAADEIRTEISAKFCQQGLEAELNSAGFELSRWWTDPSANFALSLWTPE